MGDALLVLALLTAPQPAGAWLECVNTAAFSSDCFRLTPDSLFRGAAHDGRDIGADIPVMMLVERCVLGGDAAAAPCLALDAGTEPLPGQRLEGARSVPVTYRRPILKWDQAAPSLEEVQRYGWYLYVDDVRQELTGVRCGPATGQTPAGLFSCEIEVPDVAPGVHALVLQAWLTSSSIPAPSAPRIVIQ